MRRIGILLAGISAALLASAEIRSMDPVPQNADPNSWWMKRHREKLDYVATNKTVDVVFLGDSITDYWERRHFPRWKHWFGYGDLTALNLGFAADRTEHVLWRIAHGELDGYKAKVVVLMIGTNNAGQLDVSEEPPADTILAIRKLIDEIRRHQPTARVIVNAIFPRGAKPDDAVRKRNEVVNREIARFCNDFEVIWMDLNHRLLTADGRLLPRIMPDYLHPSDEGYDIWIGALLPVIREIVFLQGGLKTPYPKHFPPCVSDLGAGTLPLEAVGETRAACYGANFVKGPFGALWWLNRLYGNRVRARAVRGRTVDAVFLGDSITHFWEMRHPDEWAKVTNRFSALNFGYAGDTTQSLLWRIENGELDGYRAKVVVLLIGTNNATLGSRPEDTAAGIRACIRAIRRKQPQAKILLHAIFPRGNDAERSRAAHASQRTANEKVNALVRSFANGKDVLWCDFNGKWTPAGWGVPERLMPDGIHPSDEGYRLWLSELIPALERICGK